MEKLTLYQWINMEYGMVKKEYRQLPEYAKEQLKAEYNKYLSEEGA